MPLNEKELWESFLDELENRPEESPVDEYIRAIRQLNEFFINALNNQEVQKILIKEQEVILLTIDDIWVPEGEKDPVPTSWRQYHDLPLLSLRPNEIGFHHFRNDDARSQNTYRLQTIPKRFRIPSDPIVESWIIGREIERGRVKKQGKALLNTFTRGFFARGINHNQDPTKMFFGEQAIPFLLMYGYDSLKLEMILEEKIANQ